MSVVKPTPRPLPQEKKPAAEKFRQGQGEKSGRDIDRIRPNAYN